MNWCDNSSKLISMLYYPDEYIVNWPSFIDNFYDCTELFVMAMGKGLMVSNWMV